MPKQPTPTAIRIFQKKVTQLALEAGYAPTAKKSILKMVKWRFIIEGKPSAWSKVLSTRGGPVAGWPRLLDLQKEKITGEGYPKLRAL